MPSDSETTLASVRKAVLAFRDARDWAQFHHPKDLAVALSIEAAEILEWFRFKTDEEVKAQVEAGDISALGHELADVLYWVVLLSHETGVDLASAMEEKLAISGQRYPVDLARGRKEKYTELRLADEPAEAPEEAPPRAEPLPAQKPTLLSGDPPRRKPLQPPLLPKWGEACEECSQDPEDPGRPVGPQ